MNKGKFIVVEGIEGAGKSSAINVIEAVLQKHNIAFIKTREPGGTPLAEALRDIVKSASHDEELTQETELFLMYASRSQLMANRILPALAQGTWVIGDRHDLSSRAYQGGGRQFDDKVMNAIADVTLKGFTPDLTLYLDIAPELGLARAQARGELDRIELEKIEFFQRVRNKYLTLATASESTDIIDASQAMQAVHSDVAKSVEAFISRKED
ncbi:dTMP kinase [Colwellia sp. M166]|jgi:dTMP kinase|uniref:dTMP kinase n=1 Tax=Colwellia sp. M166 TaxID=2583805 RepID=UPI000794A97A|nr:dTMP kinase [Colwellia sp. M166]KXJ56989.1 MAG: thymidylate kinase [Colwellia sp. Phe_37]UUO22356.1 dTMP kinase [Colwellia sp. M166]|tara:strand:- start:60701 stop:61336 length:636 start_codon:yes stop_codon:yes gene_type:complete